MTDLASIFSKRILHVAVYKNLYPRPVYVDERVLDGPSLIFIDFNITELTLLK